MPMSAFGRSRWFGDDEEDGPTPLFPPGVIGTEKNSLFPTQSDSSPILGSLKAGWKGLGDWLQAPASSDAGSGGDLLGYKPTSHISAIGDALTGAAKGVMGARGPYSNWFGSGLLGATEGLESSRAKDLQLRKLSQEQQYKQAAAALAGVKAQTEARKGQYLTGKPGDVIYDTQAAGGSPAAVAQIPDTTVVNGQLIDKATGKPIGAAIPNQPSTFEGAAVNALAPGGALPGQAAKGYFGAKLAEMTKPVAAQNTINPAFQIGSGATKYQETMGENAAKEFQKYHDSAAGADKTLNANAQLRAMITKDPVTGKAQVDTGRMQAATLPLRQLAKGMGIGGDTEKMGGQEAFNALVSQRVMEGTGGSLGAGVSNADVDFLKEAGPSLGKTPEGNALLLDISDKKARREQQISDMAAQWDADRAREGKAGLFGRDPQGQSFEQHIRAWAEKNPLFSDEEKKRAKSAAPSAAAPDYAGSGY